MGLFDLFRAGQREKLAARVIARLAARGWPHPVRYDAGDRRLQLGGDVGSIDLEVISRPYSSHRRKDRDGALDAAIDFIFDLPPEAPFERVKEKLLPILRGRKVTEAMVCEPSPDPAYRWDGAFRTFGERYVAAVALELPHGMQPLLASTYERWGRSFDEVFEVAMDNLRARPPMLIRRGPPGYFASHADDGDDLARLLLPELFANLDLKGEPVVVGASREVVFVAGSEEPEALELMARWIPEYLDKHPLPIAFAPMVLRDGVWSPYQSPANLSAAAALQLLQTAHDYEQQTPMMLRRLERTGRSPETSPMKLLLTDAGPNTIAFWRETTGLIPKTDFVVVQTKDEQIVRAWSDVSDALGLAEEPNTASPHYFATQAPDAATMTALAATPEPRWAKDRGFSISGGRLNVFG